MHLVLLHCFLKTALLSHWVIFKPLLKPSFSCTIISSRHLDVLCIILFSLLAQRNVFPHSQEHYTIPSYCQGSPALILLWLHNYPPPPSFPPAKILEKINTLSACDFAHGIREKEVPQSHVASRVNIGIWLQKEWNDARDPLLQPPLLLLISPHHGQMAAFSILPSFSPAKSNTEFMWFGAYSAQCEVWNTHTHQTLVTELHGRSLGRKTCLIVAAYITSVSVHSVWAVACIDFSMYGFVFQAENVLYSSISRFVVLPECWLIQSWGLRLWKGCVWNSSFRFHLSRKVYICTLHAHFTLLNRIKWNNPLWQS